MMRLAATMICDAQLQFRNGFYYAAAFVAVFWIIVLRQVPPSARDWLMPLFVLSNLQINTFYFVAGLVLLEKGEGTLFGQVVSPLRSWEYLISKAVTLTLLAVAENVLILVSVYGLGFSLLPLIAGIVSGGAVYVFTGLIVACRYDSVSEYLFPSFVYTLAFAPPFLQYAGFVSGWFWYIHPLQAALVLTQGAFQRVPDWYWAYGVIYSAASAAVLLWWARRSFERFIVAAEGTR